ncbi:hypothetical protein IFR05_001140 [Cadophora sp. M221]|nr:hypothetical protein IFR05_001140 [Cadophora sp. M221]
MNLITFTSSFTLLAAAILLLATEVVLALPSSEAHLHQRSEIPEGYVIASLLITGNINGILVNHTGTVEEVFARLEVENPGFAHSRASTATQSDDISHEKRYMTDVNCIPVQGQNWQRADEVVIGQGIQYLRENHLTCWLGPACQVIADYAQALRTKCYFTDGFNDSTCGGQAWGIENWNVCVYKDKC